MNKKEHITGDREWWVCICKNDPVSEGFYPCNEKGEEAEPVTVWGGLYTCDRCGRIINSDKLGVVGKRAFKRVDSELPVQWKTPCLPLLGRLFSTPGAQKAIDKSGETIHTFLVRYLKGDWGDCSKDDWQSNNEALKNDARILAVYHTKKGEKVWVITERDRSATTFLLPDEY